MRLLVVEDSADSREVLAAMLIARGADVAAVAGGAEALHWLDHRRADVIVSDLEMPGIDGVELIQRIRVRPADVGGRVPAIALTAYAAPEDRQRALDAGFDAHLAKPADEDQLLGTIHRLGRSGRQ